MDLYRQGVLTPAPKQNPLKDDISPEKYQDFWLHLDYAMLTPYGVQALIESQDRIQVHDQDGYLANFWSATPDLDAVMMRYIVEAVRTFQSNHLLATVILLGIASEALLTRLLKRLTVHSAGNGTTVRTCRKGISVRFQAIDNKLTSSYANNLRMQGYVRDGILQSS